MTYLSAMERLNRFYTFYSNIKDSYVTQITEIDIEAINTAVSALKTLEDMPKDLLKYYELGKQAESEGFKPSNNFMNPPEDNKTESWCNIGMCIGTDGKRYISHIFATPMFNADYRELIQNATHLKDLCDEVYTIKFDPNDQEFIDTCVSESQLKFI